MTDTPQQVMVTMEPGGELTLGLHGATGVQVDFTRRVIAIDGLNAAEGTLGPDWIVLDLRGGIYGGFHRLRPAGECFDPAGCAGTGQHITTDGDGTDEVLAAFLKNTYGHGPAEILAALPLRRRPGLYLDRPGNTGGLVIIERGDEETGNAIIGLAVPHEMGGWYLGCLECRAEIEERDSGMCLPCRQDMAVRDQERQMADEAIRED